MQEISTAEKTRSAKEASSKEASSLRYPMARAALTSGAAEVVIRVLTILLSVVTARILEPQEVGVLGLAVIVVGMVSMITGFPVTAGVTARSSASDCQHAFATFCLRALVTAILLIAVVFFLPSLAHYLTGNDGSADRLKGLLTILLWLPILELLSSYPSVVMQRRMDLNYLAVMTMLQPVILVLTAITLLASGYGYIGVAWANLLATALTVSLVIARLWRRGWLVWDGWPPLTTWREVASGSARMFVGGFGGYMGERADNLLVSGAIGAASMSFYSMAWNAARTPANVFARAINFVLVPALAQIQDDPDRVKRALRECLRHSYLLLAPACAVLFVSAPSLTSLVLGDKWMPIVPCLRVMSFTVLAIPIIFASSATLVGTGRAHLISIATVVHLIILAFLIPTLSHRWGVLGAAYGDLVATIFLTVTLCITTRAATRQMGWQIVPALALPIIAASSAAALAWQVGRYLPDGIARLAGEVVVIAVAYVLSIFILGGRMRVFDLFNLLRGMTRRTTVTAQSRA